MASSVIEICNRALGRIGTNQLIESLDDPNARARDCKLQYEPCRDEVLQDFPWNFAQTCIALSLVSGVSIPGWTYAYRYPNDALKVHRITDERGARMSLSSGWACEVWNYDLLLPTRMPFMVMADPVTDGAKIIVTDVEIAYAWFTRRVTDPNQFSPLFRSGLAWRLAMELALSTKAAVPLYNNAASQYGWAVSQAQVVSMGEEQTGPYPQSNSVKARF